MIWPLIILVFGAEPKQPEAIYQQGNAALEICGVRAANGSDLIQQVLTLPDLKLVEQKDRYLTMMQEEQGRFWTLAINDHPAAPAVICRTITGRKGGGSELKMEISCFADKASCDQLAKDFVVHNQSILQGSAK